MINNHGFFRVENDGIFPSNTIPPMHYKGYTYHILGNPGSYWFQILKDELQIEQSPASFPGIVPCNIAARQRIDELYQENAVRVSALKGVETIHPEPTATDANAKTRKRGRPKKVKEQPDTFTPEEHAELVQVNANYIMDLIDVH
jgi:hypothetical protein